jgi:uncharacterized protein (DUF2236 family)
MDKSVTNYSALSSRIKDSIKRYSNTDTVDRSSILSKLLQPFYKSDNAAKQLFDSDSLISRAGYSALRPFANEMNSIVTKGLMGEEIRELYGLGWKKGEKTVFYIFTDIIKNLIYKTPFKYRYHSEYQRWIDFNDN